VNIPKETESSSLISKTSLNISNKKGLKYIAEKPRWTHQCGTWELVNAKQWTDSHRL